MDETTDFLYKYVMNNYPLIQEENIDGIKALNNYDLEITFKDGRIEVYDTYNGTVRRIQNNQPYSKELKEKELRRNFKRRLVILMTRSGVGQNELADRVETTQQMISRYITGESIPNAISLKLIADALDVTVNDFYEPNI